VCARHRLSEADTEDFEAHVRLKVIENDYAILRKFQGRSSLRTYLAVVVGRLFLDYRISSFGRWRPSAQARRAGPTAVLLERLLTRDGRAFEEACEIIITNHRVAITRTELERLAGLLGSRTQRRFEREEALEEMPSVDRPLDAMAADSDRESMAVRLAAALRPAFDGLDAQDRLIMTLRFNDGQTIADIAATLRLDQRALYRRISRILGHLRSRLEAAGIDRTDVRDLLENPTVVFDGVISEPVEIRALRPSMWKGTRE
jgi:RNA polymerase sigma factor (sigma-70 family)